MGELGGVVVRMLTPPPGSNPSVGELWNFRLRVANGEGGFC